MITKMDFTLSNEQFKKKSRSNKSTFVIFFQMLLNFHYLSYNGVMFD